MRNHLLLSFFTILALHSTLLFAQEATPAPEEDNTVQTNEEPSWWMNRVGRWKAATELDWTMGSQNPQYIHLNSESNSMMILNEKYLLTRSVTNGLESLAIEGFRKDNNQFWALSIDSNRTPFTYVSGNEDEGFHTTLHPDMVLKDPFGVYYRRENFLEKNIFESKGYFREKHFMTITSTKRSSKPKDCLKVIEKSPKKPRRINKATDKKDQAENYTTEHDFLAKLVGNFKSDDKSLSMTSRLICSGRFLFISMRNKKEKDELLSIYILGVDSTRTVFQMLKVESEAKSPTLYEGTLKEEEASLYFEVKDGDEVQTWVLSDDETIDWHIIEDEVDNLIRFNKS